MTNRRNSLATAGALLAGAAIVVASGCGGSSPPPSPVVVRDPAPPPPPPKPKVTPIAELMTRLNIDPRVNLPEEKAPATDAQRKAVLEFFDGFARGDATAVRSMLSALDQRELDELVADGVWERTAKQISKIDVQTGSGPSGAIALAVFGVGFEFQPQLWYYETNQEGAVFDAVSSPPEIMDKLAGTDWIAAWLAINEQELAMADQPDEAIPVKQKDVGDGESSGASGGPSGPERGPSGPPGKRPKPKGPPRRPPGPPG